MLADYGLIGLFLVIAILFTFAFPLIPVILRLVGLATRNKPNPIKNSTYECGMETTGKTWGQFNFRYYFYAILFVAIDVLTVFLYPLATTNLTRYGLAALAILIFIITIGYIYAWRKGALEWK